MTMISSVSFGCKNGIVGTPCTPKTTGEVLKDWVDEREKQTIEELKQKEKNGTISSEEKAYLDLRRVLVGLGGILKPKVVFVDGDKKPENPAQDLYLNLLKGVKDLGLDKLIRIIPVGIDGPEKPSGAEKQAEKPLETTLSEYYKLNYEFENLKAEVARKRKDGTVTQKDEGELNVTAIKWLIKNQELKKIVGKELQTRVERGLDPKVAQAISEADLPIESAANFMLTDNSGNYIIPTKVLNTIAGNRIIKFREGTDKGKIEIETYKDGKYNDLKFGSIEFSRYRYGNEKYKGVIGYDAKIEYNFNFLEISTSEGAKPADEGHYKLTIPSTDLGIWVDKYGKLSELQ